MLRSINTKTVPSRDLDNTGRRGNLAQPFSAMAGSSRARFLVIAAVFHFVYIFSIFDIYFVSPIISGMHLFGVERPAQSKAPADRLVLFVGEYMTHITPRGLW